eukprot:13207832-Alexandrium_andersonii.AAC.1
MSLWGGLPLKLLSLGLTTTFLPSLCVASYTFGFFTTRLEHRSRHSFWGTSCSSPRISNAPRIGYLLELSIAAFPAERSSRMHPSPIQEVRQAETRLRIAWAPKLSECPTGKSEHRLKLWCVLGFESG